jgi:hypothetical protein
MLKNFQLAPGLIFAFILSNTVLPVRIMQGQAKDLVNLVGSQIVIFILCLCCWLLTVFILRSINRWQWLKVALSMIGCAILSIVFYYSLHTFFEDFPLDPLTNHSIYIGVTRMAYRGIIIGIILYPSAYFLDTQRRLHLHRLKLEQRKQQNLLAELNYLRQQMNPHFLFNALNVLKSGSSEDWVKQYTVQLAEIYRYFLSHHLEADLIPVSEELAFIENYISILKNRFGEGFDVERRLSDDQLKAFIPPLSIQILIENAIRHNIVSAINPLHISIRGEAHHIVVSNTKKIRFSSEKSGVGLRNLRERYRLITDNPVIIEQNEDFFIVKLPLLNE